MYNCGAGILACVFVLVLSSSRRFHDFERVNFRVDNLRDYCYNPLNNQQMQEERYDFTRIVSRNYVLWRF